MREQDIRTKTKEILDAYAALTGEEIAPSLEEFLMVRKRAERELASGEKGRPSGRTCAGERRIADAAAGTSNTLPFRGEDMSRTRNRLGAPVQQRTTFAYMDRLTEEPKAGTIPEDDTWDADPLPGTVSDGTALRSPGTHGGHAWAPDRDNKVEGHISHEAPSEDRDRVLRTPVGASVEEERQSAITEPPQEYTEDEPIPEIQKTSYEILRGLPDIYN